jgi:hypothetical protein
VEQIALLPKRATGVSLVCVLAIFKEAAYFYLYIIRVVFYH